MPNASLCICIEFYQRLWGPYNKITLLYFIFRRSEVLGALSRHPNISWRERLPALCDFVGRGTVSMVPDPGKLEYHGSGKAISGGRKRGQGLQRQADARTRGTGRIVDLWRQGTWQTELHGCTSGQAESSGTRYHRILRRIRDIPFLSRVGVYKEQSIIDPWISGRLAIFATTSRRGRGSAIDPEECTASTYIVYILANYGWVHQLELETRTSCRKIIEFPGNGVERNLSPRQSCNLLFEAVNEWT